MDESAIFGIGYEGRSLDAVLQELRAMHADVLVDVRLTPVSRKPGLSKTALSAALQGVGIDYVHLKALGNPRDNRSGYAQLSGPAADEARSAYRARLGSAPAQEALGIVTDLARTQRVAVLCFEASERNCHRHEVIDAARTQLG